MMTPIDTALLKHQPDYLQPLSEVDRAADQIVSNNRPTFSELVSQVFAFAPRKGQAVKAYWTVNKA